MRAIVLVLGALALGPALAARQGDSLADCRAAFHEVIPFHNFIVVGSGAESSCETDPDAYLAGRAATLALSRQPAAQGSASPSFSSAMLAVPAAAHLEYSEHGHYLTNRAALESYEAPSKTSARLDLPLAELDDEERVSVLEVARIERLPICDDPYYRALFSSYVRCTEHNALEQQQQ